jgi:hypothetical protein
VDFLCFETDEKYDLIIGNPPYFVCKNDRVPEEYQPFIRGRPNIFGLFILKSLSILEDCGVLAFVVPKSFLNAAYYAPIRNHIKKTCVICDIADYSDMNEFIDTDQATFGLVIRKRTQSKNDELKEAECEYSLLIKSDYVFTDNVADLKLLFDGSTTIEQMGLKVRTGRIVWNENKGILTDDANKTTLIYNSNISSANKFEAREFSNVEKKQYIKQDGYIDPALVVNRGNGNSAYKLTYAVITTGPYLIENHLNEIYSPNKLKRDDLMKKFSAIVKSFKDPRTKKFIEMFLGNNGMSKTELETVLPIYL